MRILTRYVLVELLKVFLISLTGLTMLFVIVVVIREAMNQSLPLAQVLRLIPFALPESLQMTVPVTLLLACTSVYGRMSGANEVVAAKALGIKPMVLLRPALGLALLLSLVTVWLNDLAASWGRNGMRQVAIEAVDEIVYSLLRSQHSYSSSFFSINVKRVEGRLLSGVTLSIRARGNSPAVTITAEEAAMQLNRAEGVLKIILRNGSIDVDGKVSARFPDTYPQDIPLTDASRSNNTDSRPASWLPLRVISGEVAKQQANIERGDQEMAAQAAYQMLCGDFDQLTGPQWSGLAAGRTEQQSVIYRLLTEPPRRWSWGFSCFCFAWVGAPIAIRLRNRDFLTSFFLCFVPILVVYYPLLIFGINGAKGGTLPCYSVWAGNIMLTLWGAWVLRKVVRY